MDVRVRDPVHNFISLNEQEVKVVDSPLLQRLRGIRQLAMASLVYPGALHTRFDHSLGVTHIAGLMATSLGLDNDQRRLVRIAALLHDIGHGPFSHVSEYALELYGDRTKIAAAQKKEKIHELVTANLIQNDETLQHHVGEGLCNQAIQLLQSGYGPKTVRNIVSGPLDADKQDYLLRDSQFCGVEYGRFDVHQLHRSFIEAVEDDEPQLMVLEGGLHAVEQFVLAKYYMTADVYRHKVRLITDQMIVRAITVGIDSDQIDDMASLYKFDNSADFCNRYAQWDDARFFNTFGKADAGTKCSILLQRLLQRRLFKHVFRGVPTDLAPESREVVRTLSSPSMLTKRREFEKAIADAINAILSPPELIDPDFVILHQYSIKSAREMSRNDEADIMVLRKHDLPSPFTEISTLFKSIQERMSDSFIDVYAPVTWPTHDDRRRGIKKLREPIIHAIESLTGLFAEESME